MAISRAQLAKELEPGLNSLFGLSYDEYNREYEEIFSIEDSNRAFEEEVLITGFGSAPTKTEGQGVSFRQRIRKLQCTLYPRYSGVSVCFNRRSG